MKRRKGFTLQKRQRWQKEGRGQGHGANYQPQLKIRDVKSHGRSSRLGCPDTGRSRVTFSNNEYAVLIECRSDPRSGEIQEQKPLELDSTRVIANEMGVRHPWDRQSGEDIVMTTDILVELTEAGVSRWVPIPVKPATEMRKPRVLAKLEIDRRYWERRGWVQHPILDTDINRTRVANLDFIRNYSVWDRLGIALREPLPAARDALIDALLGATKFARAADVARDIEIRRCWTPGTALALLRHLVASRVLIADFEDAMLFDLPASSFIAYPELALWYSPLLP